MSHASDPGRTPTPNKFGGRQENAGRKKIGRPYRICVPDDWHERLREIGPNRVREILAEALEKLVSGEPPTTN